MRCIFVYLIKGILPVFFRTPSKNASSVNDQLSARSSINCRIFEGNDFTNIQVRISALEKMCANLSKRKRNAFAINFEWNFERILSFLWKILIARHFNLFNFFNKQPDPIKHPSERFYF